MKVQAQLTRYIVTGMVAVLAVVIIVAATGRGHLGRGQRTPLTTGQQEEQRVESVMPPVISSVKDIEVVSAYVDEERQANITIRNNSDKGIQGFAVSSGSFTLIEDNGLKTDNPEIIIAPHANYLIQLPASNLRASLPTIISGALYNDYTEDGDAAVRKNMREAREREREREKKKGKWLLSQTWLTQGDLKR